ncbi:ABC transporter ATP-binding protein [Nisaea sp.]|uniref:ABC transporter ATP-binding protein n=1 Tax=Nisaea sp. TaxID=2024842 RepID=UPI003263FF9A
MSGAFLEVRNLFKSYGGIAATDHVDLDVRQSELHAIIGPNGAGKTTLIAQLSGEVDPDGGTIRFDGRDMTRTPAYKRSLLGLARSFQITSLMLDMTVLENVALAVQAHAGHSFRFWRAARKDPALVEPAMAALEAVGLEGRANDIAKVMSHGEHRQLEIAMALATDPVLLLLDEPMAGMGVEESQRMVEILRSLKGEKTMLLIEHDMDAVFALADRISVLVYGRVIATGTPEEIRGDEAVRRAYLGDEVA